MSKNKIIWAFISLIIALLTVLAVVSLSDSFSLELLKSYILNANPYWLIAAALSMFGFIFFEGMAVKRIAGALGYKRNMVQGTVYGAADVYFSAITPSASGGQPASAYFMVKDGIPGSVTTVTLLFNLIMYNLALLIMGVLCLIIRFDMFLQFRFLSKVLMITGIGSLILFATMFYLLLKKETILYKICDKLLVIPEKMHIVKNGDKLRAKLQKTMTEYKECASTVMGKKGLMVEAFFWNVIQRISQFAVSGFIFMATGKGAVKAVEVTINQCFVSMGSNTVPVPGSMGVADYLMIDGFNTIIGEAEGSSMEMLCRGLTFYGCVITGLAIVIVGYITRKVRDKKKVAADA